MTIGDMIGNDSELRGRAALVTGAASGIGRAIAERLVQAGMDVLAVDLVSDDAGPGVPFTADLTDPDGERGGGRRGGRTLRPARHDRPQRGHPTRRADR